MNRLSVQGVRLETDETRLFEEGDELEPDIRRLKQLEDVLMNRDFVSEKNSEDPLYYMYRGTGFSRNAEFGAHQARYDITILEKYDLGGERNKTLGHYHSMAEEDLAYPEIYEVFQGEVLYILQKNLLDSRVDLKLIRARAGDKVIMEPNYGHVSVNIGDGLLVMGNLISSEYKADYAPIRKMGGGAVYVLSDKTIKPNPSYEGVSIPGIQDAPTMDFLEKTSIYDQFLEDPEKFEFLNRPSLLFKS